MKQRARRQFFERLQNYMENKNEGNESKIYLEILIVLWIKWTAMVEIKHRFIDVVKVMLCQNTS